MNINSKNSTFSFKQTYNDIVMNHPYRLSFINIVITSIILNIALTPMESWGFGYVILVIFGFTFTVYINSQVTWLDWNRYFLLLLLIFVFTIPLHVQPMMIDAETSEEINELLPMDKEATLYWNDSNQIFILMFKGEPQPLAFDSGDSGERYNRLKAAFLDNKIEIEKRKVKEWYEEEDEIVIGYYLDNYKFR